MRFSVTREDGGDGLASTLLDELIGVGELQAEALCDDAADRGLPGAHEARDGDRVRRWLMSAHSLTAPPKP